MLNVLEKRGESIALPIDCTLDNNSNTHKPIVVTLRWTASVDLDLHAFALTQDDQLVHIDFSKPGRVDKEPFIALEKDDGVGGQEGYHEENLTLTNIPKYKKILFATNIFRFWGIFAIQSEFGTYNSSVLVNAQGIMMEVKLHTQEKGNWALIAMIQTNGEYRLHNVNHIQNHKPTEEELRQL